MKNEESMNCKSNNKANKKKQHTESENKTNKKNDSKKDTHKSKRKRHYEKHQSYVEDIVIKNKRELNTSLNENNNYLICRTYDSMIKSGKYIKSIIDDIWPLENENEEDIPENRPTYIPLLLSETRNKIFEENFHSMYVVKKTKKAKGILKFNEMYTIFSDTISLYILQLINPCIPKYEIKKIENEYIEQNHSCLNKYCYLLYEGIMLDSLLMAVDNMILDQLKAAKTMVSSDKTSYEVEIDTQTKNPLKNIRKVFENLDEIKNDGNCMFITNYLKVYKREIEINYLVYIDNCRRSLKKQKKKNQGLKKECISLFDLLNKNIFHKNCTRDREIFKLYLKVICEYETKNYSRIFNPCSIDGALSLYNINKNSGIVDYYLKLMNSDIPFESMSGIFSKIALCLYMKFNEEKYLNNSKKRLSI